MLTTLQLRSFGRDGYLVVPDIIDKDRQAAALARIDELQHETAPGMTGPHSHWRDAADEPILMGLLTDTAALDCVASLLSPHGVEVRPQVQVALTIPPHDHRPGRGHIDGCNPPEADGRPGSFSLLAGIVLSDQSCNNRGNLWVWPGSHMEIGDYLRREGPEALVATCGMPPADHSNGIQVHATSGALLLSHFLLSHNTGGNVSDEIRKTLYFRIKAEGHDLRWRECLRQPLLEFPTVSAAMA